MSTKKVLIQELDSHDFQGGQIQPDQMEEESQPQQKVQQIVSGTIKTDSNIPIKKDLLRLEKNYFDNIYNQEKHQNEKQFVVSKMLNQNPLSQNKPDFRALPKSSIRDKLNQFMPGFKKDTDDLLVNIERQEQMRIDDRNQYEIEQEENNNQSDSDSDNEYDTEKQGEHHQHEQEIIALKKKNKAELKNKKKRQNEQQQDANKPKMIQLDMLLGVLEQKDPNENQQDNKENDSDDCQNDNDEDEMNIEQDSSSQMTQNTKNLQNIKIQEINN